MTFAALLERLVAAGIILQAAGDRIRYSAPKGAMTPELADAVKEHRAELLMLLRDGRPTTENVAVILAWSAFPDAVICDPYAEAERDAIETKEVFF